MVDQELKVRRQWQFDWRLIVFTGFFLPLLIGLGTWQLDRARDKQVLLDSWQQQSLELSWQQLVDRGLSSGQPVEVMGKYSPDRHWLLDNRTRNGVVGYEVLTLFYPEMGPPVVVNRGWLPAALRRDSLPEFSTPESMVTLRGRTSGFPEPPVLAEQPGADSWPRRVQSLTPAQGRALEPALVDRVIRLAGPEYPGAFEAGWEPDRMGPQTHYGYAVQWYSLAIALLVLTLIASYRKTDSGSQNHHG